MMKFYHILNGDALKEQFLPEIDGEKIVLKECLMEGPVKASDMNEFYQIRAKFISENYEVPNNEYFEGTVTELEKLRNIEVGSEVNLWFEDDLFCQVNLWFTISQLSKKDLKLFMVRPNQHNQYGFGGFDVEGLLELYENRTSIDHSASLTPLWDNYVENNLKALDRLSQDLSSKYPFIKTVVKAHLERQPTANSPGRPIETLIQIKEELKTEKFGPIFQEFCKREAIYGYGDLQVRKLLDQIS